MVLPIISQEEYELRMDKISLNKGILKIDNREKVIKDASIIFYKLDGDLNKDCLLAHDLTNQLNNKNENEFFKWINILDDIASNKGTGSFYHFINLIYSNLYFGNKNINQIFGKNTFNYYWDKEYNALFLWFGKDYLKIINNRK